MIVRSLKEPEGLSPKLWPAVAGDFRVNSADNLAWPAANCELSRSVQTAGAPYRSSGNNARSWAESRKL